MTPVDLIEDDTQRWRRMFAKHLRGTGFENLVKPTGQNLWAAAGIDLSEVYALMLAILSTMESIAEMPRREGYRTFKRSQRSYYQELSPRQKFDVTFPEKVIFITDANQRVTPANSIYHTWTKFLDAIQSTRLSLVRRCRSCDAFFFAVREDQKACSARCNGRRRTQGLRERRMNRVLELLQLQRTETPLETARLNEIAQQLRRDSSAGRHGRKGGAAFYQNEVRRHVATLRRKGLLQPRVRAVSSPALPHPRNK